MKIISFTILFLLILSPYALAETKTKIKSGAGVNDCTGNCQVLEVRAPKPIPAEVLDAMQIRAAAEQLNVENPDEIRIKDYLGFIEIDQNPLNVVRIKIDGKEKYLLKVESNDYAPVLKKDDLVMVNKNQFFFFDPKATVEYVADGRTIGSSLYLSTINGVRVDGAVGGTMKGILRVDLDGNIVNHYGRLLKVTSANIEAYRAEEIQQFNKEGAKMKVEGPTRGQIGGAIERAIERAYKRDGLKFSSVKIADVKFPDVEVKGSGN